MRLSKEHTLPTLLTTSQLPEMSSFTAPTVKIGDKVTSGVFRIPNPSEFESILVDIRFLLAIGYGAMAIGGAFYGEAASDEERFKVCSFGCLPLEWPFNDVFRKVLDRVYSLGGRHIDTANIYVGARAIHHER